MRHSAQAVVSAAVDAAARLQKTATSAGASAAARRICETSSSGRCFSSSSGQGRGKRWWPPRGASSDASCPSSSPPSPPPRTPPRLPLRSPCVAVWGADTGVGKTLVSAGLAAAAVSQGRRGVLFVKPVQTGYPEDDDAATVAGAAAAAAAASGSRAEEGKGGGLASLFPLVSRRHAAEAASLASSSPRPPSSPRSIRRAVTQHAWRLPASPHAAVELEGRPVSDPELVEALAAEIWEWDEQCRSAKTREATATAATAASLRRPPFDSLAIAETAGGTLSPSPSGSLQADAWRPLRLPSILVASARLGGVSSTLAAAESLVARGHGAPVAAVVLASSCPGPTRRSAGGGGDVPAGHVEALERHLAALGVPLVVLPRARPPSQRPPAGEDPDPSSVPLVPRPPDDELAAWLSESAPGLAGLLEIVDEAHAERTRALRSLASDAARVTWWPFTQHSDLARNERRSEREERGRGRGGVAGDDVGGAVFAIDARCGEHFLSVQQRRSPPSSIPSSEGGLSLDPFYDACASWWTQGAAAAPGSSSPSASSAAARLARAIAAAAARYGHVIHPEAAHEPGVAAAEALLGSDGPGRGWASRVFWSDDGSTAVEVALKMAFRASRSSRAERVEKRRRERSGKGSIGGSGSHLFPTSDTDVALLALSGGYHGDTLGAMDATEPSVFNGEGQTPWYKGRGLFLEPPTAAMEAGGEWKVRWLSAGRGAGRDAGGDDVDAAKGRVVEVVGRGGLDALFSHERIHGDSRISGMYRDHILAAIDEFEASPRSPRPRVLGALLFEPCLQGAGGMRLVDPAFQVALCRVARDLGLPIVADEVFSGLWRLGAVSGCELLGVAPDVACYAKLLTGGTVPLAATLATSKVFEAFSEGGKAGALLHGHSYSAHAIGCAAAVESLKMLSEPSSNPSMCFSGSGERGEETGERSARSPRSRCPEGTCAASPRCTPGTSCGRLVPLWDQGLLVELAGHAAVRRAHAIGTVLAVELREAGRANKDETAATTRRRQGSSNYTATASARVAASLRRRGVYARPLGDVVYLMITPVSSVGVGEGLQRKLLEALNDDSDDDIDSSDDGSDEDGSDDD